MVLTKGLVLVTLREILAYTIFATKVAVNHLIDLATK